MMPEIADYLRILGLDSYDSVETLRKAYHQEIFKWHPDRFHGDPAREAQATEHAKRINAAFEHLSELAEVDRSSVATSSTNTTQRPKTRQAYHTKHVHRGKPFTPGFPNPGVFEVFVKSSWIVSTGYNRDSKTLYIKLWNDVVYAYLDVPEWVFLDFIAAESHGKFAHRYILHRYKETLA